MDIIVADLINLFIEPDCQVVEIFDCDCDKIIFTGTLENMPTDIQDRMVASVDNIAKDSDVLTINV